MPLWDFYCTQCKTTRELLFSSYEASQNATCPTCQSQLTRQFSTGHFVVTGYNAKNLYSKKS